MATLEEISNAIDQINIKKENLRQSFLNLQSQTPSSSTNFTLNWTEIDSYFTTLSSSLRHKFHLLKTLNPPSSTTLSQLKSFCHNSDGLGLRNFIINTSNRKSISSNLSDAYRCAPDAATMVLDAMLGFCSFKGSESPLVKRSCLIMLEALIDVMPEVTVELREKAMKVAVQWNLERMNDYNKEKNMYTFGFLRLVEAYGLIDEFSMDEVIDCFLNIAKQRDAVDLCRRMFPANKMNDLIQELINKNMQVAAVKFIIEFKKTNEFSPVDILEERVLMSTRTVENIPKKGKKHENAVIKKEVYILKSIIRCIDEYHLESKYLKDHVVAVVNKLENDVAYKKRRLKKQLRQQTKLKKAKVNNFLEAAVENSEQPN